MDLNLTVLEAARTVTCSITNSVEAAVLLVRTGLTCIPFVRLVQGGALLAWLVAGSACGGRSDHTTMSGVSGGMSGNSGLASGGVLSGGAGDVGGSATGGEGSGGVVSKGGATDIITIPSSLGGMRADADVVDARPPGCSMGYLQHEVTVAALRDRPGWCHVSSDPATRASMGEPWGTILVDDAGHVSSVTGPGGGIEPKLGNDGWICPESAGTTILYWCQVVI